MRRNNSNKGVAQRRNNKDDVQAHPKRSRSETPTKSRKSKEDLNDRLGVSPIRSKIRRVIKNSSNNRCVVDTSNKPSVSGYVSKRKHKEKSKKGDLRDLIGRHNNVNNDLVTESIQQLERNEEESFNDNVRVAVSAIEDQEFAMDDDDSSGDAQVVTPIFDEEDEQFDSIDSEVGFKQQREEFNKADSKENKQDKVTEEIEEGDSLDLQCLQSNPAFQSYVQKLVAKEISAQKQKDVPNQKGKRTLQKQVGRKSGNDLLIVKSPSDTTIYAPGLNKISEPIQSPVLEIQQNKFIVTKNTPTFTVDNISKFIEGIRVSETGKQDEHKQAEQGPGISVEVPSTSLDPKTAAKETAEKLIIEAEQFKASVNVPPPQGIVNNQYFTAEIKDDDDFFHLHHIDPATFIKIQRGEFVELEKLLPRKKGSSNEFEQKTELVFRDSQPVIVPHIDRSQTISGVRKWEQAFRIYTAIYSEANPSRSAEIWQYMFVINHAASTYTWSNVAEYDFAFRQLMAKNPMRSWSKIYVQMWNMCLTEVIKRNNFSFSHRNQNQHNNNHSTQSGPSSSKQNGGKSKPNYCWKFNKGKCKFGSNCKFVNRCSYCDSPAHGLNSCNVKTLTNDQQ